METYGDTVRKKSFFFILAPWCAHNHHITAAAKMASRQLNISSFFFKKPADAVEDAAPAVDGAALKRKIPASDPDAPPDETRASLPDPHDRATKSARTSSPASSDKENKDDDDDDVVRIPSADDRDPGRREALAKALGAASSDETKRADVQRRFRFLDPAFVRDDRGRRPSHPEYDERTCSIPAELKLSASQRQYWEIKSKYRDVVLFFKVGKFYELYEDDAEIGCRELDWKMTVSGVGHCRQVGCPEAGVDAACARLVQLGHKVGRIEQLETAAQAKARGGSGAVIRRALAEVATPATRTDGDVGDDAVAAPDATHILAFAEEEDEEVPEDDEKGEKDTEVGTKEDAALVRVGSRTVGYSFLDAAAGSIHLGVLPPDDEHGTALATLLAQVSPAEVLVRRGRVSDVARRELVKCAAKPRVTALTAGEEFPVGAATADRALGRASGPPTGPPAGPSSTWRWASSATVAGARPVARACAAAVVAHLSRLNCAPIVAGLEASTRPHDVYAHGRVRVDASTMANLELVLGAESTPEGSLLRRISFGCVTDAGRRTLRRWIAAPLLDVGTIRERQDAVWATVDRGGVAAEAVETATRGLRGGADLERAVGRARAARNAGLVGLKFALLPPHLARPRHARRVAALAAAAAAARRAWTATNDFATAIGDDGLKRAPALFRRFVEAGRFNSSALEIVDDVLREVHSRGGDDSKASSVKKPSKAFGASLASSRDPGGDDDDASEAIRDADEVCTALLERFLEHSGSWVAAAAACAELDAVSSLAAFARDGGASQPMCRPVFVTRASTPNGDPVFDAKDLWHPCAIVSSMAASGSGGDGPAGRDGVVPNDVALGDERADPSAPPAMLLTGPNMGGKSTLLRATCVAVVLAQMGAPVPASSCVLTPADAIFARLGGAGDRIHAGESTFLVECAEASAILRGATRDSIVALDELGRGTSTFDGYAVAHASFEHLAHFVRCRSMFATHYHGLSREFSASPLVQLRHMAAHVADEAVVGLSDKNLSDKTSGNASADAGDDAPITFLYKLRKGACPKSYGMKVASLAGMPRTIVRHAEEVAAAMETSLASAFGGGGRRDGGDVNLTAGERRALDSIVAAIDAEDHDALMRLWTGMRERLGMA